VLACVAGSTQGLEHVDPAELRSARDERDQMVHRGRRLAAPDTAVVVTRERLAAKPTLRSSAEAAVLAAAAYTINCTVRTAWYATHGGGSHSKTLRADKRATLVPAAGSVQAGIETTGAACSAGLPKACSQFRNAAFRA
jgi:hypothetical protein